MRKVISAVENSKGENKISPPPSFFKGTLVKALQTLNVREVVESKSGVTRDSVLGLIYSCIYCFLSLYSGLLLVFRPS